MLRSIAACAVAGAVAVNAIATISVKGSKFFTSEGDQFFVKGIAYQLVPDDPLIDATQCGLDAALMKTIGTNSIRVYHVDPNADHKDCMSAFADAGIYIWLDLDTFNTQIEQIAPKWNETQRDAFAAVMDEFHQYDNLAGFFVGNEVITTSNGSSAAPYVKAAARDLKAHREAKNYRNIPIGYSAADIATLRPMLQNYLACGTNASEALDFFSLNAYSWCGDSDYMTSGYDMLEANSTSYNIPIFMSETGCNVVRPRTFQDQTALYGEMADTWSGSIVYEWIEEANNYGLISYGSKVDPASPSAPPDGFPRSGTPIPVQPDFSNLGSVWKTLTPTGVKASAYTASHSAPECPPQTSGAWDVDPTSALPSLGQTHNAAATASSSASGTATGSTRPSGAASSGAGQPSASPGAAAGGRNELVGAGAGLVAVMAGFAWL
ncbi:1,3-beta-glucanosyltransferase gel3 precursor [Boeremia exigua]|uniref:1,3-beta-glucanosyltransferase gel3 precursor n=1 Tax=Boeremia exigua TaxID=749465 RepID=UPI001E8E9182|nr:1,3-beta-glucanosyltransferase gel3 precursor [Boeremia exigua]KAH6621721.1 1,3-beta-glucanosyltransferase gel3 precursor [Boeremia exigua]